jgi:hypothetical protein
MLASENPMYANFSELRHDEVRRINLPRTPVDNERLDSLIQNTMISEVRFRAELSGYSIERLELARA